MDPYNVRQPYQYSPDSQFSSPQFKSPSQNFNSPSPSHRVNYNNYYGQGSPSRFMNQRFFTPRNQSGSSHYFRPQFHSVSWRSRHSSGIGAYGSQVDDRPHNTATNHSNTNVGQFYKHSMVVDPSRGRRSSGIGAYGSKVNDRPRNTATDHSNTDISLYYKHSMVEDPWANMKPVPIRSLSGAAT